MLPSVVVSQIKACAERGDRVGEISVAFSISRQSVAKIITGRSHPKVRAARSVPTLVKLQADREAAERQAERDAEHDRKRRKAAADAELEAALNADPDVQALIARGNELARLSRRGLSGEERRSAQDEYRAIEQAVAEGTERVQAILSAAPEPGSAAPERPAAPVKGPDRPLFRPRRTSSALDVPDAVSLGVELKPQE